MAFFQIHKFSGFGYLLGLPAGFAFLAFSLVFETFSLMYSHDDLLYPVFFWIQLALQSEALALIALSYRFKNSRAPDGDYDDADDLGVAKHIHDSHISTKARIILSSSLPMIMVTIPFVVPISELISGPDFNYSGLANMSFS